MGATTPSVTAKVSNYMGYAGTGVGAAATLAGLILQASGIPAMRSITDGTRVITQMTTQGYALAAVGGISSLLVGGSALVGLKSA